MDQKERLIKIINKFSKQKVMVIGDSILDHYLKCSVERISPEAPVPVARVMGENYVLGGAANVANNLANLGARVDLVSCVGEDSGGKQIKTLLREKKIGHAGLLADKSRQTILKTRVICNNHQLMRVDHEKIGDIKKSLENKLLNYVLRNLNGVKTIIFSDYAKGCITEKVAQAIISESEKRNVKVLADPAIDTFYRFRGTFLIKPNKKEAEAIVSEKIHDNYSNLERVGRKIQKQMGSDVIITLGKDGMAVFSKNHFIRVGSVTDREVYDVVGAGDTAMAGLSLAISSGAALDEAAFIGNVCASIVVGKLGTAVCAAGELLSEVKNNI